MRLADKAIVVTGAAHGIGRAYSERLASEGASVALLDIDAKRNEEVAEGINKDGGKAVAITTDVRDFARHTDLATTQDYLIDRLKAAK